MTAQRITLNLSSGKGDAVLASGSIVSAGEVMIEIDDSDIQAGVEVTIEKISQVIREQLF